MTATITRKMAVTITCEPLAGKETGPSATIATIPVTIDCTVAPDGTVHIEEPEMYSRISDALEDLATELRSAHQRERGARP